MAFVEAWLRFTALLYFYVSGIFGNGTSGANAVDATSTTNLMESTPMTSTGSSRHGTNVSTDYTELMGGSVPCPSCKGSGRIPKEMEETLVALIPVNDDRLKPKRTWIWVLCGVIICLLLAGTAIFMLVPRTVQLASNGMPIQLVNVYDRSDKNGSEFIKFYFMNSFNISNGNYYAVTVVNTTAQIISRFQPFSTEMIGTGANETSMDVAPLSSTTLHNMLYFNNSVTLAGYTAQYCQSPYSALTSLYVNMQFDIAVILQFLGHTEQVGLRTIQQVCCIPSGNCTA
ncbi:hypothetical protein L596_009101 [Steinernema carpocapsae]|uniref:Transmembrane protein n=1 Tax=Steinernema carpocapsae TaxID=34508 RepID=A0A4U5PED8_STECR|nr:hypothetical protein L596_009101 [Steinernema carpocapsae]